MREHAGPQSGAGRHIHIDQRGARLGVCRRCHRAHPGRHLATIGGIHHDSITRLHLHQVGIAQLGLPFQPALPDELEQLGTRCRHGAFGRRARRDDTIVGCPQLDVLPVLSARRQRRLSGTHAGLGRTVGREVLVRLLLAHGIRAQQTAGAFGVGARLHGIGLRFHQRRLGLGHILGHGPAVEARQHLPPLHRVPHIDQHLGQRQRIGFGRNAGLLPCHHVTIGHHLHGQKLALRRGHRHHHGRPCLAGIALRRGRLLRWRCALSAGRRPGRHEQVGPHQHQASHHQQAASQKDTHRSRHRQQREERMNDGWSRPYRATGALSAAPPGRHRNRPMATADATPSGMIGHNLRV